MSEPYLIPIRILLQSNLPEFRATTQRELRALQSESAQRASVVQSGPRAGEARTAAGARTSAQAIVAENAGNTRAQVEAIRPQIGNALADQALEAGNKLVEQFRAGLERSLQATYGAEFRVPAPTEKLIGNAQERFGPQAQLLARQAQLETEARTAAEAARGQASRTTGTNLGRGGAQAYESMLAAPEGTEIAAVGGKVAALDIQLGRVTGIFAELALAEPAVKDMLVKLRETLSSLAHMRQTIENGAIEQARVNSLQDRASGSLAEATGALARVRLERVLAESGIKLDATEGLVGAQGADASLQRARQVEIEGAKIASTTDAQIAAEAQVVAARQAQAATIESAALSEKAANDEMLAADAEALLARKAYRGTVNEEAKSMAGPGRGSIFQRVQASIANRQGGAPRSPQEFQSLGQFATSRVLTTASFAASGALLYGGVSVAGKVLHESEALQRELGIIKTQFADVQQSGDKITFAKFRKELSDTAVETGVAADEVANVTRQLAGAFADQQGRPNFSKGQAEAKTALSYSSLPGSGFQQQEITDSLTAISLAFKNVRDEPLPFDRIIDQAIFLENKLGVISGETIKFVADIAPLGKELGFTYEQLAGIGAVAQQASGKSGQVLADQFSRVLPFIQQHKADIVGLFAQNDKSVGAVGGLSAGFADNNISKVLTEIIGHYKDLDATQKNTLADLIGGQRNASAVLALFNRAPEALKALNEGPQGKGELEKRVAEYHKSVTFAFAQIGREAEKLGNTIFNAGVGRGLKDIAEGGQLALRAIGLLVSAFQLLNHSLGGMPARMLVVYTALKSLQLIAQKLAETQIGTSLLGNLGLGAGAGIAGGEGVAAAEASATAFHLAGPGAIGSPFAASGRKRLGVAVSEKIPGVRRGLTSFSAEEAAATGGLVTEGETAAGLGTAVVGGLATAGLVAGGLLAVTAISRIMAQRAKITGQINDAVKSAQQGLDAGVAAGLSESELAKAFDRANRDGPLARGSGPAANKAGGSRGKAYREAVAKARLKVNKKEYEKQINAISKGVKDDDVSKLFAEGDPYGLDSEDSFFSRIISEYGGKYDTETAAGLSKTLSDFLKDHPGDAKAQRGLVKILKVLARINPAYKTLYKQIETEFKNRKKKTKGKDDLADAFDSSDQDDYDALIGNLQYAVQAGTGTTAALVHQLRGRRAPLARALSEAKSRGLTAKQVAQYQKTVNDIDKQINDALGGQLTTSAGLADAVAGFTGTDPGHSTVTAKLANAKAKLAALVARQAPPADQAAGAIEVINAQRAALDKAIADSSPEDALKLIREGVKTDPAARTAVITASLSDGPGAKEVHELAKGLGVSIKGARDIFVNQIEQYGEDGRDLTKLMIQTRLDELDSFLDNALAKDPHAASGKSYQDAYAKARALQQALHDLDAGRAGGNDPGANQLTGESPEDRARSQLAARAKTASANLALLKSQSPDDPVKQAREARAAAQQTLLRVIGLTPKDTDAIKQAMADVNDAKEAESQAVRTAAQGAADAAAALDKALAHGDPSKEADAALRAAQVAVNLAKGRPKPERDQAQANLISAQDARVDDANDIQAAHGEYLAALLAGDPIAAARQQLANANQSVSTAKGAAAKWRAMIQQLQSQRDLRSAILDAFTAQKDVAIAVAEGAGETVKVALLQLQIAQQKFNEAKAQGTKGAALDELRADAIRAQNNVISTQRADKLGDLDYMFQMDKITATAYISLLQAELKKIPESNKQARQQIMLKIKSLRDQLAQDLQLNLPSDLRLPVGYEARRLNQTYAAGGGSYQDNRNQIIVVNEATDGDVTIDRALAAMGGPTRSTPSSGFGTGV